MNLYKSENFVDALLMDSRRENVVGSQWLLNPFLKSISFGRVDGKSLANSATIITYDGETVERQADYVSGAALKFTFADYQNTSSSDVDSIAYPNGEFPKQLFKKNTYQHGYPHMVFAVVAENKKVINQRDIDFSKSAVEILGENGQRVAASSIKSQKSRGSLPKMLTWKADDMKPGIKYTVKVNNVKVADAINDYEYWFKLR